MACGQPPSGSPDADFGLPAAVGLSNRQRTPAETVVFVNRKLADGVLVGPITPLGLIDSGVCSRLRTIGPVAVVELLVYAAVDVAHLHWL